ncbi:hypothetical protein ELE36_12000 [Pseudolysobacter antarcticus]|uniref:Sce7726 family protein n=1 Tax=Pseudolysobacter antarcticus TaxID=2511995 RepID=A0A411HKG2_9GAMM|nr:sce7726 family protein [Pseudolysobacter antarcticus]QBB71012.1 hypothetical protein ELE36_12000 [Pseudolysobacter antarcticus]
MTNTLKEPDLKALVLAQLRKQGLITPSTILATEYAISTSSLRADLAILGKEFIGIEIKSELDSLRRLSNQLLAYQSIFEKVILVIAEKHWQKVQSKGLRETEIWRIDASGSLIAIHAPLESTSPTQRKSLISLMTKRERSRINLDAPNIYLASEKDIFTSAFRERFAKTSQDFWRKIGQEKIDGLDLKLLSRFSERRFIAEKIATERHQRQREIAKKWLDTSIQN